MASRHDCEGIFVVTDWCGRGRPTAWAGGSGLFKKVEPWRWSQEAGPSMADASDSSGYLNCSRIIELGSRNWDKDLINLRTVESSLTDPLSLFFFLEPPAPSYPLEILSSLLLSSLADLCSPPRTLWLISSANHWFHPLIQGVFIGTVKCLYEQFSHHTSSCL